MRQAWKDFLDFVSENGLGCFFVTVIVIWAVQDVLVAYMKAGH